jgi:hypothetical protein
MPTLARPLGGTRGDDDGDLHTVKTVYEVPASCGRLRMVPELRRDRATSTWLPGCALAFVGHCAGLRAQLGPVAADALGIRRTNGKVVAVQ